MSCKIGFDGVLQVSAAYAMGADISGASLTTMGGVRDVNTSVSQDTAEVSDRGSAFKAYCPGMVDLETTVEVTYNMDNTELVACIDACINRKRIQIAVLDGAAGAGFTYWAMVTSSDVNQPLTEGMTVSLTFKPVQTFNSSTGALIPPAWDDGS